MRVILMGTGPFAVPMFDAVVSDSNCEVVQVITKPDPPEPAKKPKKPKPPPPNPVLEWARGRDLPVSRPVSPNSEEFSAELAQWQSDLLIVCDYGHILSRDILGQSRFGGINLHGSLLPRHRGAAPVQWSVLRGDRRAGVSVILMTPRLDGGPVIDSHSVEIGAHETAEELERRLSQIGVAASLSAIEKISQCDSVEAAERLGQPQDKSLVTKAPRLHKSFGQIDPRCEATLIDQQIRGLQPWPGVYGEIITANGKPTRVIFGAARPLETTEVEIACDDSENLAAGDLLTADDYRWLGGVAQDSATPSGGVSGHKTDGDIVPSLPPAPQLLLVCGNAVTGPSYLQIAAIQIAGKRVMDAAEFVRGYCNRGRIRVATPDTENPLLSELQAAAK